MKTKIIIASAFAALTLTASADNITLTTNDGQKHTGSVMRVEPDGVVLSEDSGIEKVPFSKLPADVQKKYGYDAAKAAKFKEASATAQAQREQEIRAQKDAAAQNERISNISAMIAKGVPPPLPSLKFPSIKNIDFSELKSKNSTNNLEGQIFITTDSGESIKFGGIEIYIYPLNQLNSYIGKYLKWRSGVLPLLDSLSQETDKVDSSSDEGLIEKWSDFRSKLYVSNYFIKKGEGFYLNLPKSPFFVKSDADGKFSIKLPNGNFLITASKNISISDNRLYTWLVKVNLKNENKSLLLSNDNRAGYGSKDSLF